MQHFTHLHVHTEFSLLDGAIGLDKLIAFAKNTNARAIGISDHGNIFGAVKFFQMAQKAGVHPILGMEAYITEDCQLKDAKNKYYHLLLIVQNKQGYKNLCKLISHSYTDGFYFKPRIDYHLLERYSEGLIVTTACLGGHIPQLLMTHNFDEAQRRIEWYLRIFGENRFFLEVQPEDMSDQKVLNNYIWEISKSKGIQTVATGDCHYVSADDREAHEVMLAIQTHAKITDEDRFTFGDARVYLRTCEEMLETFKGHEDAVWASGKIADSCDFTFETGTLFFPQCALPNGYDEATYFKHLSERGLQKLIDDKRIDIEEAQKYWDRLYREIDLITTMGFIGYFLVVSDFIQWAKEQNIPVGPGRGSAAGSLVAWALQITDIDPLKYNLLFERFLNPERVSMPDIDIDFCIEGRDKVINYVRERYGADKVCQIITFGTMMAKGVIKDVARVLGFPFEDSNALTELIPDQLKITLKEALETEPRLKKLLDTNENIAKLFDLAFRLEGITRHASKHAAGIVISPEPIDHVLPVYVPPKTSDLVTQYAMTELESLGFLKMDFLGLKNLTLIDRALKLIQTIHGVIIDIPRIPLDDQKTFELLAKGQTAGVFQLESEGIKDVLRRLEPQVFEDIIAVNALYRPGPLGSGMVDDFIERKHGRQAISYIFPDLESVLQETYGVIVYQEQVMKIASLIGGYSLGEADILRRAMGKKKADVMAQQKSLFIERATSRQYDQTKAAELFELMAYFAGYGFNKSHSAAYALIAYQTAYLKAHYPAEFMACLISLEAGDPDKMAHYLNEAKSMHLSILPPDLNTSVPLCTVENGAIRFGLNGIRNLGSAAIHALLTERQKNGTFKDLLDFCMRIDLRVCNKRTLESLIYAGACDTLPGNRAQKIQELSHVIDTALDRKKAKETGQMGLFETPTFLHEHQIYEFDPLPELPDRIKLEKEKEMVGVYVSAQPLDAYAPFFSLFPLVSFIDAAESKKSTVMCCGSLTEAKTITTKKGDLMAFAQFEDQTGTAEVVIFPSLFATLTEWLDNYTVFIIKGTLDQTGKSECKIKAQKIIPFDLVMQEGIGVEELIVTLPDMFTKEMLQELKQKTIAGKSRLSFIVHEKGKRVKISTRHSVSFNHLLWTSIQSIQSTLLINF